MRLQSAIFTLGDTLFTPDGAADWSTMQQLATQSLAQYSELLSDSV